MNYDKYRNASLPPDIIRELEEIEALELQELLDRKRQDRDSDDLF
jgi:hypothetical protein